MGWERGGGHGWGGGGGGQQEGGEEGKGVGAGHSCLSITQEFHTDSSWAIPSSNNGSTNKMTILLAHSSNVWSTDNLLLTYRFYTHFHLRNQQTWVCLLVGCLTSQQHASVSQGRTCSDNFTCCHTEIEVADQTFYLTQSQYTDTGPTIPSADPITPGAWQGSHCNANF